MAPGTTQASRYRRGKLPQGAPVPSDESSDEEEQQQQQQSKQKQRRGYIDDVQRGIVAGGAGKIIRSGDDLLPNVKAGRGVGNRGIQLALKDVKVEKDGGLLIGGKREVGRTEMEGTSEEEDDDEEEREEDVKPGAARPQSTTTKSIIQAIGADQEGSSEYETDSGEEEESSEEEPPKPVYRPTFVPKRARETVIVKQAELQAEEELWKKKEEELKARKKESRNLVGESIRRELAEKEATENVPDVDDTDDIDPEAEFEAWRLRELSRLTRDKEAALEREAEKDEIERRRAMPEAQRLREDEEYARKTREAKEANRGEGAFMEKFYHKGAFYQDEDILKRNYNVKTESAVDVSLLPKAMQVRNFGKYTHLKDQDTTQGGWDRALHRGPAAGLASANEGCFNCGGPHLKRDCPNPPGGNGEGPSTSGTNNYALSGQRSWGNGGDARGDDDRRQRFEPPSLSDNRDRRERGSSREPASRDRERKPHGRERDDERMRSYDKSRHRDEDRSRGDRDYKTRLRLTVHSLQCALVIQPQQGSASQESEELAVCDSVKRDSVPLYIV
ncbi:hypothetical protein QFC22_004049 [Naganishia vaughanmartiniae]|uniref:Uncharacterized protein n=1 Tax=Naganishia vaughanmartiniae TaxID=1424756 RepID=A0ACC2X3B7_9TREE|nr:hypothetical protein QFC22_004049 [Naganishia vaughanmartiniae]